MKTGLRHLIVPKTLRLLFKDLDTPDGFSPFQQEKKRAVMPVGFIEPPLTCNKLFLTCKKGTSVIQSENLLKIPLNYDLSYKNSYSE